MTAMKTTILQQSNTWWEQTQADILAWWHQTGQKHWQKWGVWVWILICCALFAKLNYEDMARGFMSGLAGGCNCTNPNDSKQIDSFAYWGVLIGTPLIILAFILIASFFGVFHYLLIYKPIIRRFNTANIVLYLLVCLIIYSNFLNDIFTDEITKPNAEIKDSIWPYIIWAVSLMFSIIYDFRENEKNKQTLKRERNIAEIQALKAQINPHFLFNTLNNLYGTAVLEESPKTADGIQQLARIMRHAVESSKNDRIEIDKEISFLHDYIEIQQLRIPKRDNIRIQTAIQWDEQPAQIAPLILMTFAENAFKFGISIAYECFLEIKLTVESQQLTFICRNSVLPRTSLEQGTGTGLDNTLKRLKLLYPKKHTISINQTDSVYEVFLTINLHD